MSDEQKSTMLEITNTWPQYFEKMDEGLGTTYERFILHHYFQEIKDKFNITSLLEVPSFGMTGISGINSLWWPSNGIVPTVIDTNADRIKKSKSVWSSIPLDVNFEYIDGYSKLPFKDKSFDMSWNFASLWFVKDLKSFLNEMIRVTKNVIFICVPNSYGIGFVLRKLLNKKDDNNFYPDNIKHRTIKEILFNSGWTKYKSGYFDIPPWPDIAMKKEDLFNKIGLGFIFDKKEEDSNSDINCIVNYFNGSDIDLENRILKYSFLEKSPFPIKQLWGHHRYFIFVPDSKR